MDRKEYLELRNSPDKQAGIYNILFNFVNPKLRTPMSFHRFVEVFHIYNFISHNIQEDIMSKMDAKYEVIEVQDLTKNRIIKYV